MPWDLSFSMGHPLHSRLCWPDAFPGKPWATIVGRPDNCFRAYFFNMNWLVLVIVIASSTILFSQKFDQKFDGVSLDFFFTYERFAASGLRKVLRRNGFLLKWVRLASLRRQILSLRKVLRRNIFFSAICGPTALKILVKLDTGERSRVRQWVRVGLSGRSRMHKHNGLIPLSLQRWLRRRWIWL